MSAAPPSQAWRRTSGGYTRYVRTTAAKSYFCLICRRADAIQYGDRTLVRASDNAGRICLGCEPRAGLLDANFAPL